MLDCLELLNQEFVVIFGMCIDLVTLGRCVAIVTASSLDGLGMVTPRMFAHATWGGTKSRANNLNPPTDASSGSLLHYSQPPLV